MNTEEDEGGSSEAFKELDAAYRKLKAMVMSNSRGWYWHEKARISVAYWAFVLMDCLSRSVWVLSRHHLDIFRRKGKTTRVWDFWIWLGSIGYLYDDWRKGDLPEHQRWPSSGSSGKG